MKTFNFLLVAGDTDGLAFKKPDESPFTPEERAEVLAYLNSQMDPMIRWEDDGVFPRQIVIKTKNYVLVDEKGKRKTKGSALKATMKEKAFRQFIQDIIDVLLEDRVDDVLNIYLDYARRIMNITDISDWCSKKTITEAVLNSTRPQELRIREALKGRPVQEGDKIFVFFKTDTEVCLKEDFNGIYDADRLLGKLYKTMRIFETVIDIKQIPNLTLKKNRNLLKELQ